MYYKSVRQRNKDIEVDIISKNTNLNKNLVKRAYEHYLMNKYNYYYREAHGIVERKYNFSNYIEK